MGGGGGGGVQVFRGFKCNIYATGQHFCCQGKVYCTKPPKEDRLFTRDTPPIPKMTSTHITQGSTVGGCYAVHALYLYFDSLGMDQTRSGAVSSGALNVLDME